MKKVLIMGANPETVSLILKAKEMGYTRQETAGKDVLTNGIEPETD